MKSSGYLPRPDNPSLPTRRRANSAYRSREYLHLDEVAAVIEAAELRGRHPERDKALLLLMFRHGLRVGEACELRWDAVGLLQRTISIARKKNGRSGVHPLQLDEVAALTLVRERYPGTPWVFPNERGGPLGRAAVARILDEAGALAQIPLPLHPHMLRHSCGYYLANQGLDTRLIQEWLGHRSIEHTVTYTQLNPKRFESIQW